MRRWLRFCLFILFVDVHTKQKQACHGATEHTIRAFACLFLLRRCKRNGSRNSPLVL
jgi:hypothetical protein